MNPILECVPNFSEGRDKSKILQITNAIESVEGIKLLEIDPGEAANRTVVTFIGAPEAVVEAAFQGIKKAAEVIDMRQHKGVHPRFGATDVCPLVPVQGISFDETVALARSLGKRVGEELHIPVYMYEHAADHPDRKNLAKVRAGEYEGLPEKLKDPFWQPDFGPCLLNEKAGAVAIGARDFLVAYNINLDTDSIKTANEIAAMVRESGSIKRDPLAEQAHGERIPGRLKRVKAIGWFIEEYKCAQVSMNLTDISVTPVHIAFEEVKKEAGKLGVQVTGSELVGMIPKSALLNAGKYYFAKEGEASKIFSEQELIQKAVQCLGLDFLKPFDIKQKVIEFHL